MEIEVTQHDIDDADMQSFTDCPVARAIRRMNPNADIEVDAANICIDGAVYDTPPEAEEFINAGCGDDVVSPFVFTLNDRSVSE